MGLENITLGPGELYVKEKGRQEWRFLAKVRSARIGMDPAVHAILKIPCKYRHFAFDLDKKLIECCDNPAATPTGESWGACDPRCCPLEEVMP